MPAPADKRILKATEPSILRIGFDPDKVASLRPEQVKDAAYHIARILSGRGSAESEWKFIGLKVDLVPWNGK